MIARFLFTAAHALFWAATDARDIRNGKNINHGVRWAIRAAIEVGTSLVFAFIRNEPIGIRLVLVTIAAAFLFSALFRFLLNTMRGRHWNYISPSSLYDWMFLRPFMHPIDRTECVEAWHVYMASMSALRAGRAAYIFEAVVFALLTFTASVA